MKRLLLILSMFLMFPPLALAQNEADAGETTGGLFSTDEMRMVMTFNLKYADHVAHPWEERRDMVVELLQEYQPLLIGTQEGLDYQLEYLVDNLENYEYIGISRQGNTEDEYSAIFYDTSRVELLDSGTFWLSETPDEPGSMSWGAGHPRIATWGEFNIEGYPRSVYLFNTHLSFEESITANNAQVLLEQMQTIVEPDAEVLVTGDFNIPRMSHVWKMFMDAGFKDAWQIAEYSTGPNFTRHEWEGPAFNSEDFVIDWVLYRGPGDETQVEEPMLVKVVTYNEGGNYPSDHFPVILTTLGNPEIEVDNLSVDTPETRANELVIISAEVTNTGERGAAQVELYVDRGIVESEWLVLDAGETQQVTFDTRLYEPGEHQVSVALLPPETVTVGGAPATLGFTEFAAEPYVHPGQAVPVTATIENTGSYEGSMQVNLFVGDQLADSTLVTVPSGETKEVGFVHTFDEAGAYGLSIGNQTQDVAVMRDIAGEWHFQRGDDMAWTETGVDTADWEAVELPASWEQTSDYTEDRVYGWYRETITVPADWQGRPIKLLLGQIDDVDMTYFNGEKIGQTGTFPQDEAGFESQWNVVREYVVPPELINYGEENLIAVRIYDEFGGGGIHGGPLGILPLNEEDLAAQ